jgi:hypothetical protein
MRAITRAPCRRGIGNQPAVGGEDKDVVGVERRLERVAGRKFVHAGQHGHPVRAVALEMDEAFRAGDFGQRHRRRKNMVAGRAIGDGELVGAEAHAVRPVGQPGIESVGGRRAAAAIDDGAVLLLDGHGVEGRIGEQLRDSQAVRPTVDARRATNLQRAALRQADGAPAQQQRFRRLGGGVDEDGARHLEDARQLGAQFLAQLVVEIGQRLVEQHQIGALDQRAGDGGALLLAARQSERQAVEIRLQPQQAGDLADPSLDLLVGPALHTKRRGDVLEDGERGIVDELLVDHRHRTLADVDARHVLAVHDDAPRGRRVETGQQAHQRGLARQCRTQKHAQRSRLERERDVSDEGDGADDPRGVFQGDGHAHRLPPASRTMPRSSVRTSAITSPRTGFKDASPFHQYYFRIWRFAFTLDLIRNYRRKQAMASQTFTTLPGDNPGSAPPVGEGLYPSPR